MDRLFGGSNALEDSPRVAQEDVPRLGQLHPSRRSDEERRSELVLEAADLSAHCRLRDAESIRCTSDVALLGDGDEILNLRQAHGVNPTRGAWPPSASGDARSKRHWIETSKATTLANHDG
jgi:hypothetical protein